MNDSVTRRIEKNWFRFKFKLDVCQGQSKFGVLNLTNLNEHRSFKDKE